MKSFQHKPTTAYRKVLCGVMYYNSFYLAYRNKKKVEIVYTYNLGMLYGGVNKRLSLVN